MSKVQNKHVGKIGEELAGEFLKDKGYEIVEKNWGSKWGEIDIIAKKGEMFVFVEVKTKIGEGFGSPEEMINKSKLQQVQRMASVYMRALDSQKRIDVVAVVLDSNLNSQRINHYEAVY